MQENDSKTNPNNPNIRREVDMKQKEFIANILTNERLIWNKKSLSLIF